LIVWKERNFPLITKRVTSQDVADQVGVSRTTVSLVLNKVPGAQISDETRRRVIQAAAELGYVPDAAARALASRRAQIIGLVLARGPHHLASDAFIIQILDGLIEVMRNNGMRLLTDIVEPYHQEGTYLDLVRAKRIDGIILSGPRFDDKALRALEGEGFPTVLMGQLPKTSLYSVDVDNYAAAKIAVAHLINLGHTRIACITNAPTTYTAAAERLRGYREALEAAGLHFNEEQVRYGDFDPQSGYAQMNSLLDVVPHPTAVFVASDVVAFGAMAAIRESGLAIPNDIALVGFDDVPFAKYFDPPLTTMRLPAIELAREASKLIINLMKDESPDQRHVILSTNLVIRESCGYSARRVIKEAS
jgi:LacI family transcriptional regulator